MIVHTHKTEKKSENQIR